VFDSHEKNYKMQKSEFGKCRRNSAMSDRRCRIPARKFDRIRPETSRSGRIPESSNISDSGLRFWHDPSRAGWISAGLTGIQQYPGRNLVLRWPDSGAGRISTIGCCWTPAPVGFRRPTIVKF
jgi:hypothetical protein